MRASASPRTMLFVLHPIFALTGVADAITGPMLPSLARSFRLTDSQSGVLLFCTFAGMATGALLCRGNYARVLTVGLCAMTLAFLGFCWVPRTVLYPVAFFLGASIGAPMTAVSLFAGRNYPTRRAATLTMLNFTWSAGAMLAPLLAARVLAVSSWHAVYLLLAGTAGVAAVAAGFTIHDSAETARTTPDSTGLRNLRVVALFAVFLFLEVGMETTFGAWISTYVLRVTLTSLTLAAASAALYWAGFLVSRGLSSLLLLRMNPDRLLWLALLMALGGATLLATTRSPVSMMAAILLLGVSLAPVFPVVLAAFFERARHSSDSTFILAVSGFGGSLFPWLVGWISSQSGSLRTGLWIGPVTLLAMIALLPVITIRRERQDTGCGS